MDAEFDIAIMQYAEAISDQTHYMYCVDISQVEKAYGAACQRGDENKGSLAIDTFKKNSVYTVY